MDNPATIFLVEDDKRLRDMLEWFLVSHNYVVAAASSVAEALSKYDPDVHGCLVLDINLPEGSGLDLLKEFRSRGGEHPFVIMTAYSGVPIAVEAMRLGAVDFLEKPFQHETLLARVQEALAKDLLNRQQLREFQEVERQIAQLGPREWEVALLVSQGMVSKEIANRLGISPGTVAVHRRNILAKLRITSAELAALVIKAQSLSADGRLMLPQ